MLGDGPVVDVGVGVGVWVGVGVCVGVPVGLIHSSWGGSPAEAWTSFDTLMTDADFKAYVNGWERAKMLFQEAEKEYPDKLKEWRKLAKQAEAEKKYPPPKPLAPTPPPPHHQPAG